MILLHTELKDRLVDCSNCIPQNERFNRPQNLKSTFLPLASWPHINRKSSKNPKKCPICSGKETFPWSVVGVVDNIVSVEREEVLTISTCGTPCGQY